jgi:hypothetical protein
MTLRSIQYNPPYLKTQKRVPYELVLLPDKKSKENVAGFYWVGEFQFGTGGTQEYGWAA